MSVITPEGRATLGVDQARRAISSANLRPVESDRKVIIFDDASMMTESAANALLKTLEEPPAHTVVIVVVESEDDLPITVASRCRIIRFGRVPEAELSSALVARGIDPDRSAMTARIAGGSPGLALDLVNDAGVGAFRHSWLAVPGKIGSRPGDGYRLAEEIMGAHKPLLATVERRLKSEIEELESRGYTVPKSLKDRQDRTLRRTSNALLTTGLEIMASFYIDSISAQCGGPLRNPDLTPHELTLNTPSKAVRSADLILDAAVQLRRNQRPRLVLAWLFATLGQES